MASTTADPAALLDMAAEQARREERAAAAAAASSSSSSSASPSSRYARAATVPRHALPLDLLLAPRPTSAELAAEASRASAARARRDLFTAPRREATLMLQAAAIPLAIFAYGVAANDPFCAGLWDRYWPRLPRVRLPQLRPSPMGNLEGGRQIMFSEADNFLRATTRHLGRLPAHLRPRPKGPPGVPPPPTPPVQDW